VHVITTYAQNFEDVLLWRALGRVENGHYVDVGANDPDVDSVTRLFYDHGWRGINIEPMPDMYARLVEKRPGDVCVRSACGDHSGEAILFDVVGTGLSTLDAVQAEKLRADGMTVVERTTPIVSLDDILAEHGAGTIHFLKIDVEGGERSVLAGCDLRRWRPWVLVIEATAPRSHLLTDDAWEPSVLSGGYSKAYFDGLNNYYVAEEHPELLSAFRVPPNVFDDFVLPLTHGRVSYPEVQQVLQRSTDLSNELLSTQALIRELEEWGQTSEDWTKTIEVQLQQSQAQCTDLQARYDAVRSKNDALRRSASWRVTFPLRAFSFATRISVRASSPTLKAMARPVLDAGLTVVRRNRLLKAAARRVIRMMPRAGGRLHKYATARPPQNKDGE
jgi:FkbM family methyltransferase